MSAGRACRLPRVFFARDTRRVARALLGCTLVHRRPGAGTLRARIVETEAYHGPDDRASHARFGRSKRAAIMFGPPGVAYVYLIYGMHHCLNVVTGSEDYPAAVLVRAIDGLRHRGPGVPPVPAAIDTRVDGPGRLTRALAIDRATHNGALLIGAGRALFLEGPAMRLAGERIVTGPRVGVAYAGAWAKKPWRYRLLPVA